MVNINLSANNKIELIIDTTIYSNTVISKVLYWFSDRFIIVRENIKNEDKQCIVLEKMAGMIAKDEYEVLRIKLSQNLVDYKNREIIYQETKDIRNILYVKAFAHSDDFVEMDFQK